MAEKIGVYVCHCGSNIAGKVDVEEVAKWAGKNCADVCVSRDYKFMCSSLGQAMIEEDIKKEGLTRVVVAACSPHLHEKTFRRACSNAGLNPYLMDLTNVREHCSWVHKDRAAATEKTKALVAAAVGRVKYQQPLEPFYVNVNPATLVIGGGIAGLQATLELADAGYPVYLVERQPSIGGHMAQFDKTFPTLDCSACILTPKMSEAGQHENVTLLTYAELEEVSGSVGNFKVKIRQKARHVDYDKCTGCGICVEKCPRKVLGYGIRGRHGQPQGDLHAVPASRAADPGDRHRVLHLVRAAEVPGLREALPDRRHRLRPAGRNHRSQRGQHHYRHGLEAVRLQDHSAVRLRAVGERVHEPGVRAVVQRGRPDQRQDRAAGRQDRAEVDRHHPLRRQPRHAAQSVLFGHLLHGLAEVRALGAGEDQAQVYSFYIDMRTNQKNYEEFYQRLLGEGMHFIRGKVSEVTDAARLPSEQGKLIVQCEDTLIGKQQRFPVDMVVLMGALEPQADAREMGLKCGISCSMDGWYTERHPKLDPVATMTDGIFVAGVCQGPKDIPASVAQGAAAAARVGGMITKGKVMIEPVVATINEAACSGCKICNNMCPYNAIEFFEDRGVSHVITALCKGCGTCVSACPAGVITGAHFNNQQIDAEIEGILWDAMQPAGAAAGKAETVAV